LDSFRFPGGNVQRRNGSAFSVHFRYDRLWSCPIAIPAGAVLSGGQKMETKFVNPPNLCPTFGWTHVATVSGGTTVYVSGQVSVDERGTVVGAGDLRAQTLQAFHNVALALAGVGATFDDVVKTNLYVVGLKPEHVPIIREVRSQFVSHDHPPVSTLVGVSALVSADWLIEIEAVAVLPEVDVF
jgi:enamine deaminase RidA (YjgF/YER057c/UK114 family)